jgi:hypothetical protein
LSSVWASTARPTIAAKKRPVEGTTVSDIDYMERIERGLLLFLREKHGITAETAYIGESNVEEGWEGCDTCGYGGGDDTVKTPIYYKSSGWLYNNALEIDGTSLEFLPELLNFIDRAN